MLRRALVVVVVALVAAGFGACSNSTGSTRTVQVDFNYDEFAGSFLDYFPSQLAVRPGMTVRFDQTWTGAPHSVSFVDRDAVKDAPPFFTHGAIDQAAAQPCFVKALGAIPRDGSACAASSQVQPEFDGSYAYYSSGLILPTGQNANRFDVKIAKHAKEGSYFYYCSIHGVAMSGQITIARDARVVAQRELNRQARVDAKRLAAPVLAEFRKERAGKTPFAGNLAGSGDPTTQAVAAEVNEFTPKTIYTNLGSTVMWTFVGNHTISFNVPKFAPLFRREDNGDVVANDRLDKPQGGWPGAPPGHRAYPAVSTENVHLDAGVFDGSGGLRSSGIGFNTGDTYTVTFSKRGTYPFACLIHPGMIGKVVVK